MTPPSAVAFLAERLDYRLDAPVNDGQQNAVCPVGSPQSMLPLLKGAGNETEAVGETLTTQPEPHAEGDDPA